MSPTANATGNSSLAAVSQASDGTTPSSPLPDSADENVTVQDRRAAGDSEAFDFTPRLEAHFTLELCGSCSRMYVSARLGRDRHFFAGEVCCAPVDVNVTATLDLSDDGGLMQVAAFDVSRNFTCGDVTLRRRRGPAMPDDLRAELSGIVSRKVEAEVRGALESTYAAVFEDELRDAFPRVADLAALETSGAAALPVPSPLTSSGSSL